MTADFWSTVPAVLIVGMLQEFKERLSDLFLGKCFLKEFLQQNTSTAFQL